MEERLKKITFHLVNGTFIAMIIISLVLIKNNPFGLIDVCIYIGADAVFIMDKRKKIHNRVHKLGICYALGHALGTLIALAILTCNFGFCIIMCLAVIAWALYITESKRKMF